MRTSSTSGGSHIDSTRSTGWSVATVRCTPSTYALNSLTRPRSGRLIVTIESS